LKLSAVPDGTFYLQTRPPGSSCRAILRRAWRRCSASTICRAP